MCSPSQTISLSMSNNNNNIQGFTAQGWENVRQAFEQNFIDGLDIGASFSVYHRGRCVVDLCGGWKDRLTKKEPYTADTLQLVYSVSKGIMAAAIALCIDRGWLDYDAPVMQYWPEFGVNGKEKITVGQLLSHRAGLPCVDKIATFDEAIDWNTMTSMLAIQKPMWEPGTKHGYHSYTHGYLCGELLRRVDPQHRTCGQFIRDELDKDFHFGVTDEAVERRVARLIRNPPPDGTPTTPLNELRQRSMTCNGVLALQVEDKYDMIFNRVEIHRVEIPSANGITNARSLARIYASLIGDIDEKDEKRPRLISKETLQHATTSATPDGETDEILYENPTKFAQGGFQLYGSHFEVIGPGSFGHIGMGGSCSLAYPPQQLSFAHVCNHLDVTTVGLDPRTARLINAVQEILQQISS